MKGLKTVRFGLAGTLAAALIAVGAFLLVSQASATVSGTLTVSSPNIPAGQTGTAEVTANVPAPGLGAWTVDIAYDPSKVTVTGCNPSADGVCNSHYAATQVRLTGASANGHTGSYSLGTITLSAAAGCSGTTPLTATTNVFADATIGAPANVTVTITSGSVNCAAATAVPPTATTAPILVVTGTGPGSGDSSNWLIVALAGAGLAALAGYGALRLRSKAA